MKIKSKIWLEKRNGLVFGEGKSELLKAIDGTGSISKAAKKMGISFRHGWGYITAIEKRIGFKLIERKKGGRYGGGSSLTPKGRALIKKFDKLKTKVDRFTDDEFKEVFSGRNKHFKNR